MAQQLRKRFAPAEMRLLMMSGGNLDETTLLDAGEAGFDSCVDKTSSLEALLDIIRAGRVRDDLRAL